MKLDWQAIGESLWKYKVYIGLGLGLIALVLFLWQGGSNYFFSRDIDRKKANVNAALTEANAVAANINAEKAAANKIAENVNIATNEYLGAINATDATRENVNAAIERMKQAAKVNGNVNAAQVEEAMRGF